MEKKLILGNRGEQHNQTLMNYPVLACRSAVVMVNKYGVSKSQKEVELKQKMNENLNKIKTLNIVV